MVDDPFEKPSVGNVGMEDGAEKPVALEGPSQRGKKSIS